MSDHQSHIMVAKRNNQPRQQSTKHDDIIVIVSKLFNLETLLLSFFLSLYCSMIIMSSTPTPNNNITLWQASQSSSATPITTPTPVVTTPTPVVTAQKGVESIIALSSSSDEAVFMGEKSDPLLGANLDDVVTSAGESNWVKKPPRDKNGVVARKPTADEVTRLESINGINIADIGVQHLRGYCKNQKIKATHSQSKKVICDRIVKRKADREKDESCGVSVGEHLESMKVKSIVVVVVIIYF